MKIWLKRWLKSLCVLSGNEMICVWCIYGYVGLEGDWSCGVFIVKRFVIGLCRIVVVLDFNIDVNFRIIDVMFFFLKFN